MGVPGFFIRTWTQRVREPMQKPFTSALFVLEIFIFTGIALLGEAGAYFGPATVKVDLLPVYAETSVTSGIVKFLKKGDVVEVQGETIASGGKWCSVKESGRATMVGFVNCYALEYSQEQGQSFDRQEKKPPSAFLKSKDPQPSARQIPAEPQKESKGSPQLGEFLQALWNEDIARVKDLLEKGADPNAQTTYGTRPLLIAVKKRNQGLIKLLIEKGAQVDGRDRNGLTALMAAASAGRDQNVLFLIAAGADVNARDQKGLTPLIWATVQGYPHIVEILLNKAADVNTKIAEGLTAQRLSQRIIADLKRSLDNAEKANNKEDISRLRRNLARHEQVLRLLESTGGK